MAARTMRILARNPPRSIIRRDSLLTSSSVGQHSFSTSNAVASSSRAGLYPFPRHPNPTPHEIFHLPRDANQDAIKSRYYELVKIHHPDSAHTSNPASAHEHFQRIQAAYAQLRRMPKRAAGGMGAYPYKAADGRVWTGKMNQWGGFEYEYDEQFREKGKGPGASTTSSGPRKTQAIFHEEDTFYWVLAGLAVVCGIAQFVYFSPAAEAQKSHASAVAAIDSARKGREEHGAMRREELKRFVQERRLSASPDVTAAESG